MAEYPWRLVTVDIDGTLTTEHGWRPIALAFDSLPAFESTNRRFLAGEIGQDEHLENLLNLATGHTTEEVQEIVARTPKLSGIGEGITELHRRGARVAVLSHNPSFVTDYYRRTFGFDAVEGVDAQTVEDGRIGPAAGVRADKAGGLWRLLRRFAVPSYQTVHLGDGPADVAVFGLVGAGVALNSRLEAVNSAADLVLAADDFRAVVEALGRLAPRARDVER